MALIIVFVFGIIGPSPVQANPGWYDTNWQYRKKITINAANVTGSSNLIDFPVLISVTSDSDIGSHAQLDGDDILFTQSDEVTILSHEIESFSSNGVTANLTAWVKIPSLSYTTDTEIYVYYGYGGVGNQEDATNVWDSNFKMVQHLEETTGGTDNITDSTSNNNHGTDNVSPSFGATGQIDGAIGFNGANSDFIHVDDSASLDITSSITLEAWIYPTVLDNVHRRIIVKPNTTWGDPWYMYSLWVYKADAGDNNNLGFGTSNGTAGSRSYSVNGTITTDTWQHVAGTYNGTAQKWYINGDLVGTKDVAMTIGTNNVPLSIGSVEAIQSGLEFGGTIDEVRISSTARSVDWLKTSYNNQSNPSTFLTLGSEEGAPFIPSVTTNAASFVEETTATINGALTNDGGEACQYSFEWGLVSGGPYTANISWTGSINSGESFSTAISSLDKGKVYYFRARAKNIAGIDNGSELSFLTKPDEPASFTATTASSSQINLSWTKGDGANRTMVRGKQGSYPTSISDGDEVYFGTDSSTPDTGLLPSTTYFYSAWSEVSGSQQWSDNPAQANATTTSGAPTVIGGKVFTVNKAAVIAPWLLLAVALSLIAISIIRYFRKKAQLRSPPEKTG